MLTAKENMYQAIKGGKPERFVNQYEGVQLLFTPYDLFHNPMAEEGGPEIVNAWGVTMSWPAGTPGEFPVHTPDKLLVKDIEDWKDYVKAPSLKFPDSDWEEAQKMFDAVDGTKSYKAAFIAPGIFEQVHYLCSLTEALVYYMTNEDEMAELIKYITEWELEMAEGICSHLHPDAIFHHDDWGSEINSFLRPEMFEDYFLDPYKEIYKYYHDHGVELIFHHSDSYGANLVEYMIEMGIDVWQGCMETNNVGELVDKYGDKITFMGNIDNKDVDFEGWTPEVCYQAADRALDEVGLKQGYIPCITQGGPGSVYPGTYMELVKEIDRYNCEHFGCTQQELEAAREELQVLF